MTPAITVDLRQFDFDSHADLKAIVHTLIPAIREDYPMVAIHGLVISDRQLKLLRLERYMKGVPLERVKEQTVTAVDGWEVMVAPDGATVRCKHCGELHGQNQPWYDEG